jgi:MraZ protein
MFSGSSEHIIDDKGRIVLPVRFRSGLGRDFVITRGIGPCLFVLPLTIWNQDVVQLVENRPLDDENAARLTRFFFSEAQMYSNCDAQGRISLSAPLREHAIITENSTVMIAGVYSRIELWSYSEWRHLVNQSSCVDDIVQAASILNLSTTTDF